MDAEEKAFLTAITEGAVGDNTLRGVYADYLQEAADHLRPAPEEYLGSEEEWYQLEAERRERVGARGKLIRVQIELATWIERTILQLRDEVWEEYLVKLSKLERGERFDELEAKAWREASQRHATQKERKASLEKLVLDLINLHEFKWTEGPRCTRCKTVQIRSSEVNVASEIRPPWQERIMVCSSCGGTGDAGGLRQELIWHHGTLETFEAMRIEWDRGFPVVQCQTNHVWERQCQFCGTKAWRSGVRRGCVRCSNGLGNGIRLVPTEWAKTVLTNHPGVSFYFEDRIPEHLKPPSAVNDEEECYGWTSQPRLRGRYIHCMIPGEVFCRLEDGISQEEVFWRWYWSFEEAMSQLGWAAAKWVRNFIKGEK